MKAINYLTAGAAMLGLAAFGASMFRLTDAKAGRSNVVVTADSDPAQAIGGSVGLTSNFGQNVAELAVGPFYLTDSFNGGTNGSASLGLVPSGSPCAFGSGTIPGSAAALHGLRFFVPANQKLCAWIEQSAWGYTAAVTWSGFRPY